MKNKLFKILAILAIGSFWATSGVMATPLALSQGSKVLLVDGDSDVDVNVALANNDVWDGYYLKYSVNGGGWSDVEGWIDVDHFVGGDVLDFALQGSGHWGTEASEFYVLSHDQTDSGFSATMNFYWELDPSESQQPVMGSSYYKALCVTWNIGSYGRTHSGSFALNFCNNDGLAPDNNTAPVPEPATMFLLGTGLVGLARVGRRRKA